MSGGVASLSTRPSQPLAWAQLVRLPNVFTAMADIALATLVTDSLPGQWLPFLFLVLASSCLYCAGMVWNDYFDYEQDLKERPQRPIPSQRISLRSAAKFGIALIAVGLMAAIIAGLRADSYHFEPMIVAVFLTIAILLYDFRIKRTFLGPVNMGLCRFLNVLLGFTVAADGIPKWVLVPALVVGIYITGVTWFARREARISKQLELLAAALVMLMSLPFALFLPVVRAQLARSENAKNTIPFIFGELGHVLFPYFLVSFGLYVGLSVAAAIRVPQPKRVQQAIKRAVLGLIIFDAILATSLAGTSGLLILLLLLPAVILGKWIYST